MIWPPSAPDAWFLNYTNPMAMLTGYMQRYTPVKTVGLCHSVQVCAKKLLAGLEMEYDPGIRTLIAGINHQAWLLDIRDRKGNDLYPEIKRRALARTEKHEDMVRYEIMKRFGYYVTESSEHSAEYVPYFIKDKYPELIERFNIPLDEYPRRCIKNIEKWATQRDELIHNPNLQHEQSREYASHIMAAMETNTPYQIGGNVINTGLIPNLPQNACVEVPCLVDGAGVTPCYVGALPDYGCLRACVSQFADSLFRRSGFMACKPRHSFGPIVHDCFLFHIILSGSGVFEQDGKKYTLHTGQGFLIWPGKMAYYEADAHDPWKYAWLGFRGADALRLVGAMGLNESQPVWELNSDEQLQRSYQRILRDIPKCTDLASGRLIIAGDMLNFLSWAGEASARTSTVSMQYCDQAIAYIRSHLTDKVTVEQLAAFVGLSRSQLFRAFKEVYGKSPREMLAIVRTEQAQYMLLNTSLPLEQVALSCGYANESHFCVSFKRESGLSPMEFRKSRSDILWDE